MKKRKVSEKFLQQLFSIVLCIHQNFNLNQQKSYINLFFIKRNFNWITMKIIQTRADIVINVWTLRRLNCVKITTQKMIIEGSILVTIDENHNSGYLAMIRISLNVSEILKYLQN